MKAVGELWTFFLLNKERQMAQAPWGRWRDKGRGGKRVGKKKSLGQVYLAVVCPPMVLIARKHWRWANASSGIFLHGAGQWVFPGGAVEESDKDIESAAIREFPEETEVDLNEFQYHTETVEKDYYSFCVLLVGKTDFDVIANAASDNIAKQKVKDYELAESAVYFIDKLGEYLGKYVLSGVPEGYDQKGKGQSIDWYAEMAIDLIDMVGGISEPHPSSSSSSSSSK